MLNDVSSRSLTELWSLEGRGAVVTGAARGLGASIARRLSEAGASVVMADLDEGQVAQAARAVADATGGKVVAQVCDMTSDSAVEELASNAVEQFGQIDVWINNAGVFPDCRLVEMTPHEWDRVHAVNSRGTFLGSRAAAKAMIAGGNGGTIVNLSSIAGVAGSAVGHAHYAASKHAVVGLTKALASELGEHGIRAVGVAPGAIETEGLMETMENDGGAAFRAFSASLPAGRAGIPDDIARVVVMLATDMAMFLTGDTVVVDGGYLTR